jgi:serine/threonine protein kinase
LDEMLVCYMENEIKVMKKCQNKNVIQLIESYQNDNYIYIVMEVLYCKKYCLKSCEMDLDRLLNEYFDHD